MKKKISIIMKKLGIYLSLALLIIISGAIYYSCQKEDEENIGKATPIEQEAKTMKSGTFTFDYDQPRNPYFYFLSPIVPTTNYTGNFNAGLSPTVEICEWNGASCNSTIATYTMTTGPGAETVRVSKDEKLYIVNWLTKKFNLKSSSTYRIHVFVEGTLLGYTDVLIVSPADLKNKDKTGKFVWIMGSSLPIKFRIEVGAVFVVGPDGGTITPSGCGCSLKIPQGALSSKVGITILPFRGEPILIPGPTFEFGPNGLEFAVPAILTMHYDESKLAKYPDESKIMLFMLEGGGWKPLFIGSVDPITHTLSAPIEHFTPYGPGSLDAQIEACISNGVGCESFGKGVREHINELEGACRACMTLESKIPLWIEIVDLAIEPWIKDERLKKIIGSQYLNTNDACGGLFDPDNTYIYQHTIPDIPRPPRSDLDLVLGYEQQIGIFAEIKTRICDYDELSNASCGPEITIGGNLSWASSNSEIAEVDGNGMVTTKDKPGSVGIATFANASMDLGPLALSSTAQVNVGEEIVDILFVSECNNATAAWMGFDDWSCPTNLCMNHEWYESSIQIGHTFRWWGMGGHRGDISYGRVAVDDPGIIGISLNKEGPFVSGPIDITYTTNEYLIGVSEPVYYKATGVGSAKILTCFSPGGSYPSNCDPFDETHWGHQEYVVDVSPSIVLDYVNTGVNDIGTEVVAALGQRFGDYRFGFTAFGGYPSLMKCDKWDMYPEWRPYAEPQPFYDWVPLTNAGSTIAEGLSNTRLICETAAIYGGDWGTSAYSALLHAIQDTPWREGAERVIIAFMRSPVNWAYPANLVEPLTGNTSQMVIDAAVSARVRLFTLSAGRGPVVPFTAMAESTNGTYHDALTLWPMLNALETVFDDISLKIKSDH